MSDAPTVQVDENNNVTYRASAIGGCLYALAAARQGKVAGEVGEKQQELFDAGHETEDKYLEALEVSAAGVREAEVRLPITHRIRIVGHIDLRFPESSIEVKSQSDLEFDKEPAGPLWDKYKWQVSVYHHATGYPVFTHRVRRSDLAMRILPLEFYTREEITNRVLTVEAMAAEDDLVCARNDFFCQYSYLHASDEPVDEPDLDELLLLYLELKNETKQKEGHMKLVRERITELMGNRPKVFLLSGRSVTRSEYEVKAHEVRGGTQVRITVSDGVKK